MRELASRHGLRVVAVDKENYTDLQVVELLMGPTGQGAGTRFMTEVCEEADRRGAVIGTCPEGATPELTVRLRQWYQRLGFRPTADERLYPVTFVRFPIERNGGRSSDDDKRRGSGVRSL